MNVSLGKVAAALSRPGARQMSSTAKVWVDKNTKVICQGFTGKQVGSVSGLASILIENGVWCLVFVLSLEYPFVGRVFLYFLAGVYFRRFVLLFVVDVR